MIDAFDLLIMHPALIKALKTMMWHLSRKPEYELIFCKNKQWYYEQQTLTNKANDELAQERTGLGRTRSSDKACIIAQTECYTSYFLRFCTKYDTPFSKYRIELIVVGAYCLRQMP